MERGKGVKRRNRGKKEGEKDGRGNRREGEG